MKLIRFLSFMIYIFCLACGGGTGGTGDIGGPDTRFYGTVISADGEALANAEVTVADSGDSAYTDRNGNFDIVTKLSDNSPQLLVRSDNLEQIIDIGELTSLDSEVKLSILVDSPNNSIKMEAIEISARDQGEASSAPSQSSSSSSAGNQEDAEVVKSIFKGSVVFEDGEPVEGARIALKPQNIQAKTNSNGKFRLEAEINASNNLIDVKYKSSSGQISLSKLSASKPLVVNMKLVVRRPVEDGGSDVNLSNADPEVVLTELDVVKRK